MNHKFPTLVFLLLLLIIFTTTFDTSHAKPKPKPPQIFPISFQFHQTLNSTKSWLQFNFKPSSQSLLAATLSFLAAAVSSAGGIGGGGLFIPILTIAAGVDLKTASSFSAFMVSGGSLANVGCHLLSRRPPLIDYDIALLSEPCMLLGVSAGVILNVVLPEWLITASFAVFLAFCTFKTCAAGVSFWSVESRRRSEEDEEEGGDRKVALLLREEESGGDSHLVGIPWGKVGMLILIWFSFFVLYLLRGNSSGQENGVGRRCSSSRKLFFPLMALLAGVLGGVFGIGGGMLISPLLLQIGIEPQATAATCSFMVFFSSIMSAMQYLLLGMEHVDGALGYAAICFIASLVGLTIARRAVMKHGRASLIVFAVGVVMALSTVLITGFGAVEVWNDYTSGESMGFKKPC
ncbi:sulfite exporter TauE/SafE family protein 5-like isoform X2 [Salvia hispanica]|uniref:sulfite exporter TauE/SafE family protein 5-like isoform X2 n=1 Tax=Salvia hispanica TaxID=49212 RepID=UPI00200979B5|nr:sulfite exporter TauE/SafE family protein 5-like isoform X2 [Salvia hispanica]